MTSIPSNELMAGVTPFNRVPLTQRQTLAACMIGALLIAIFDTLTPKINLSVLYSLLVVIAARRISRRHLCQLTAFMVLLTFSVYGVKNWMQNKTLPEALLHFKLVNRTLATLSLLAISAISYLWIGVRQRLESNRTLLRARDEDRLDFEEVSRSLERFAAGAMCGILTLCIIVIDLLAPGQFNFPILYAVPLVICYALDNRRMLWMVLPWLLLFTVIGYWLSPAIGVPESSLNYIIKNRVLTAFALVALSALLNRWMRDSQVQNTVAA